MNRPLTTVELQVNKTVKTVIFSYWPGIGNRTRIFEHGRRDLLVRGVPRGTNCLGIDDMYCSMTYVQTVGEC